MAESVRTLEYFIWEMAEERKEGLMVVIQTYLKVCYMKRYQTCFSAYRESITRVGEYSSETFWLRMRKNCHSKVTLLGKLQVYWQSSGKGWMSENNHHSNFLF